MRLVLLTTLFPFLSLSGYAQRPLGETVKVNLAGTLPEVLETLEEITGYTFAFTDIPDNCEVKITEMLTIKRLLDRVTSYCHMDWEISGKHIILTEMPAEPRPIIGWVVDAETDESVGYAKIYLKGQRRGVYSGLDGRFKIIPSLPARDSLIVTRVGYEPVRMSVQLTEGLRLPTIKMKTSTLNLAEAIVESDKVSGHIALGTFVLDSTYFQQIFNLSNDAVRLAAQLPSVAISGDIVNNSEISVRGGEPDENLILMDNVDIPFPWFFSGKSIFNPLVLEKAEFMAGGFPSVYGEALSSVFNFSTRNGSLNKFSGDINVGLMNSNLALEGPFKKDKASWLLAFRNSNLPFIFPNSTSFPLSFDITAKVNAKLSNKHSLSISSIDFIETVDISPTELADSTETSFAASDQASITSVQLQSVVSKKLYNKLSLNYGAQDLWALTNAGPDSVDIRLDYQSLILRNDASYYAGARSTWKFGVMGSWSQIYTVNEIQYVTTDVSTTDPAILGIQTYYDGAFVRAAGYLSWERVLGKRLELVSGLRAHHRTLGQAFDLSPRVSLKLQSRRSFETSLSWGLFHQPVAPQVFTQNQILQSERAQHIILGWRFSPKKRIGIVVEGYYKSYDRLIVFDTNHVYTGDGVGWAAGGEIFAEFNYDHMEGRVGYAFSRTERERPMQGSVYPLYFEQQHRANAWLNYLPGSERKIVPHRLALHYRYNSGSPFTPALAGSSMVPGGVLLGAVNSSRFPDFHNVSFRSVWRAELGKKKTTRLEWYLEMWNVFNRSNVIGNDYIYNPVALNGLEVRDFEAQTLLVNLGLQLQF